MDVEVQKAYIIVGTPHRQFNKKTPNPPPQKKKPKNQPNNNKTNPTKKRPKFKLHYPNISSYWQCPKKVGLDIMKLQ